MARSGFAGTGRADEHDILCPPDEIETGEAFDLGGVDSGLLGKGEGVDTPVPGQFRLADPIGERAFLAVAPFLLKELQQHLVDRRALFFGLIQEPIQDLCHAVEAQGG